jgi:hypothetical protein
MHVLEDVPDAIESGNLTQGKQGGKGEQRCCDEKDELFCPCPVNVPDRFDIQLTEWRILR